MQERRLKSFIRIGESFIDIKRVLGFSFYRTPGTYVNIQFVTEQGHTMNLSLRNKNELSLFLMELEHFIDDENALKNMQKFIDKVEKLPIYYNQSADYEGRTNNEFIPNAYSSADSGQLASLNDVSSVGDAIRLIASASNEQLDFLQQAIDILQADREVAKEQE